MATITIFAVSLFGCISLLVSGYLNVRRSSQNFFSRTLSKTDALIQGQKSRVDRFIVQMLQSIRYLFKVLIPELAHNAMNKVMQRIKEEYEKRNEIMQGRRDIHNKGAVSFYLRKIAREDGDEGAIE